MLIAYHTWENNMLADDLKILLATQYAFAVKTQYFHWNVEGPDFAQLHEFFQNLYQEVYNNSIDRTAEYIRSLDEYTPGSMERFVELSAIAGQLRVPRARLMIEELLIDATLMIDMLNQYFESAEQENQQGIANFIAERLDAMAKHAWMLRSFLKDNRA
jgi:starvation-inducible DNA-binding protein